MQALAFLKYNLKLNSKLIPFYNTIFSIIRFIDLGKTTIFNNVKIGFNQNQSKKIA